MSDIVKNAAAQLVELKADALKHVTGGASGGTDPISPIPQPPTLPPIIILPPPVLRW